MIDPGIELRELLDWLEFDSREWNADAESWAALSSETLSLPEASYLSEDRVKRFWKMESTRPSDDRRVAHAALLNPLLTCGQVADSHHNIKTLGLEQFLACNEAAAMSLEEANLWSESIWIELFVDLALPFDAAFHGCQGFAYVKAVANNWRAHDDPVLRAVGMRFAPEADKILCTMTTDEKVKAIKTWKHVVLRTTDNDQLPEDVELSEAEHNDAIGIIDEFWTRWQVRSFDDVAMVLNEMLDGLGHSRGWSPLGVAAQAIRDFRETERIAGKPPAWYFLSPLLETP